MTLAQSKQIDETIERVRVLANETADMLAYLISAYDIKGINVLLFQAMQIKNQLAKF